jgi:hypothetical protein
MSSVSNVQPSALKCEAVARAASRSLDDAQLGLQPTPKRLVIAVKSAGLAVARANFSDLSEQSQSPTGEIAPGLAVFCDGLCFLG